MKKLIFLLLLAQTISFLYGDAHCIGYIQVTGQQGIDSDPTDPLAWRWGIKAPKKIRCDCNCPAHLQANYVCTGCNHKHLPTDFKLMTTAGVHKKSCTHYHHKKVTKKSAKKNKTKKSAQ